MAARTLRERYCEVFHCSQQGFSEHLFLQCLPPRAARMARLLQPTKKALFKPDFELIEQVSSATSVEDIRDEINDFRYHNPPTGLLRGVLRVRVSSKRLLKLGTTVLSQDHPNIAPGKNPPR